MNKKELIIATAMVQFAVDNEFAAIYQVGPGKSYTKLQDVATKGANSTPKYLKFKGLRQIVLSICGQIQLLSTDAIRLSQM